MFRSLAFVSMWQKQNNSAGPLPFRFRRNDKLVDDGLRAVRKIAELRFPQAKHLRIIERITVIESEHGRFGKQAVVNTKARLFRCEMQKRNVRISRYRVVKNGMPVSKGPAAAVLAGQSHRCSFQKERSKGERFGKTPIVRAARFEDLAASIDQHPFYFRKNIEILRHARETIDDFREPLWTDGGRCG